MQTESGGSSIRQTPRQSARIATPGGESASPSASRAVLSLRGVAELIGVSERTVHDMRASGRLPEPIQIGPRSLRWFRDEVLAHLAATAPRGGLREPAQLARRRGRGE